MVVRIDTRIHLSPPTLQILAWIARIRVQDARQLNLQLNGAVLVEDPIHAVLIVCCGEDLANEEFARAGDGARVVSEVGMLEEDAGVFFVDADCVFDGRGCAGAVDEFGVFLAVGVLLVLLPFCLWKGMYTHVMDGAFAVAT